MLALNLPETQFRKTACMECGCGFKCISGLCPFGYNLFVDCYPYMTSEEKFLFEELLILRKIALRSIKKHSAIIKP
jgi:threonine synthase